MPTMPRSHARSMQCWWFLAFTVLISAVPGSTTAQGVAERRDQPEMIPRDLVVALLSFGQPGNVDIRVGKVPEDVPPELIPPGAQLLGSMTQFETVVIVLAVPEAPDSAIGTMASRLLAGGWVRPPAQPRPPMQRGFVSADFASSGPDGAPSYLCRGDSTVNLMSIYRMAGGSLLRVNYSRSSRNPICRQRQDERAFRPPYDDAPIPTLRAPVGSMMSGSGMSSANEGFTMHARLSTRQKPAELVAHFDTQMKAAGWTALSDGAVEFMAARRYEKKDERGRTWYGTLYAIAGPQAMQHDVALHLARR